VVESASLAAADVMRRGPQAAMNVHNQANPTSKKDERTS
jgi:hypothetical protein